MFTFFHVTEWVTMGYDCKILKDTTFICYISMAIAFVLRTLLVAYDLPQQID